MYRPSMVDVWMDLESEVHEPERVRETGEAIQTQAETLHTSDIVLNPMMS